jgi:flagellar protein FliO/FliZ
MGTMGVAIRMVISLAVVLCLLFVVARFARRGRPRAGGPQMDVISRVTVGSKASVAVVRLGERAYVVGVTEQSVTLLSESPVSDLAAEEPDVPAADSTVGDEIVVRRVVIASTPTRRESRQGKLAGSALSPETWRRTVESVRDLTVRK